MAADKEVRVLSKVYSGITLSERGKDESRADMATESAKLAVFRAIFSLYRQLKESECARRLSRLARTSGSRDGVGVDSALSEGNPEEAVKAPGSAPGVGDDPVVDRALMAPADDLHSVAADFSASLMCVDSTLVAHEVLIHSEGSLNGSAG